ncbi:ceramide synthase 6-like isoform X2 [Papio anubis]|uniref:ceramide synthase 6-like isoform X2 n=1 Tax=Papio anubis TaxID=9555 RepID=UPI0012AE99B6|nr:ceramide synthase 6-like isoform X2 [Papio anubis]
MTFLSTWQTFIPSCQRGGSWERLLTFCFRGVTRVPWKAKENATFTNHLLLLLRVLNTTLFESWEIVGPYPSWWVFNLLLLLIQGLNCFWSYLIVKIACKAVSRGKVSKDDRSDIESSSDEEDSEPPGKNPHTATTTNGTSGTNGYLLTGSCSMDD